MAAGRYATNFRAGVDHNSFPTCLGQFGTRKMNENGQCLLDLCCHHGLCVSNTFFKTKPQHRVSWRHPRSKHWHQLDLILTRRFNLSSIKMTRSYQNADCDTDHSLVCINVKLRAKSQEGRPRIDTSKTHDQRKVEEFAPTNTKCPRPMGTLQRCCILRRHVHLRQTDQQVS